MLMGGTRMTHTRRDSSAGGTEPPSGRYQDSNLAFCDRKFQPSEWSKKRRLPTHNRLVLDVDKLLVSKSNDGLLVFNAFIDKEYAPRGRHAL